MHLSSQSASPLHPSLCLASAGQQLPSPSSQLDGLGGERHQMRVAQVTQEQAQALRDD